MDDKTLDNIFKTAFTTKSRISQEEGNWDDFELLLKKKVRRKNFFFFSWNRFNIYYVGILLASFMSGSLIYCQNYLWNAPANSNLNTNPSSVDTSLVPSDIRSEKKEALPITEESGVKETGSVNQTDKDTKSIVTNPSSTSNKTIENTTPLVPEVNIKDTVSSKSKEEPPASVVTPSSPVVVMRRKKTVVVVTTPADTIIKIDTVKVKKGKNK